MTGNWLQVLGWVLLEEGGFVNDPHDPGGATNMGITQRVYDAWRQQEGQGVISVRTITKIEAGQIYKAQFWNAIRGDELPSGVDYCTMDLAVNSGVVRASKFLQLACGAGPDGHIGVLTLDRLAKVSTKQVINADCDRRLSFLQALRTWRWFGRGWKSRVARVRARSQGLAGN